MTKQFTKESATIASGAALTGAIALGNKRLASIQMPAAWTAAALTFQASHDGVTFANLYDANGIEVNIPAAASYTIALDPVIFCALPWLKIRSGTAATPVNQAADRVLSLGAIELVG